MRRVVSVWFPTLPTDRLRQQAGADGGDAPLVTATHDGRRQIVAAADAAAVALGLRAGMPLAQARALIPDLSVHPAAPDAEAALLRQFAGWGLRYTPLAAPDPPDGIWLDVTGSTHLLGGEIRLLRDLTSRLAARGMEARASIADTPGAAHAMARFGTASRIPPAATRAAIDPLPIAALRLAEETCQGLRLLGFERIGQLLATERAPLVRRFGARVATRLDQALGAVFEPIIPVNPPELIQARLTFIEPLLTEAAFATVIARLTTSVCATLETTGQGARRLDLLFERVDGSLHPLRIGTARPSRDARHLARMLGERLERVDPGLGVEVMRLIVVQADTLPHTQTEAPIDGADPGGADIAELVDRLSNRLGPDRVYRAAPVESDVPERAVRRIPALRPPARTSWPADWPRPVRLLDPPQPVEAMALLPDQPPVAFTWRRVRHRVRHADGPERIAGEWWKRDGEIRSVRDYFRVEDDDGRRFWLFRRGDGDDPATGDLRWFLHGFF